MKTATRNLALAHALESMPRESCGLVLYVGDEETYFPCENIAENQNDFVMNPADFASAEDMGRIAAVVHSHPRSGPKPSQADLVGCELSALPWFIVSAPGGAWETIVPKGYRAPYVGRPFVHGVLDCYSLIRDWYRGERGVELPDFERREKWWEKGDDLYRQNFEAAGFARSDDPLQVGDIILMQNGAKVPNHGAIYIGAGRILHHVQNRLSTRDVYGSLWVKNTRMVLRYR